MGQGRKSRELLQGLVMGSDFRPSEPQGSPWLALEVHEGAGHCGRDRGEKRTFRKWAVHGPGEQAQDKLG